MANLKPWYKVVTPREDLRESKPLDASEFAVHLDQVRDGRAPTVYRNADEFLDRTYLEPVPYSAFLPHSRLSTKSTCHYSREFPGTCL